MRKITTTLMRNVGEAQHIKLLLASTTGSVDRPQDGEGHAAANKGDHRDQLEEAQQQIGIHGVVLQHMFIGQLVHGRDPIQQARRRGGSALRRAETAQVRPGHVHATLTPAQNDKDQDHDHGGNQGWNQGPDQTGR